MNTRMRNLPTTVVSTTLEGPLDWPDFEGSSLLAALKEVDEIRAAGGEYPGDRDPFNRPPDELISDNEGGRGLREDIDWPSGDYWVAVRVDLGVGTFPDVEETARDQVVVGVRQAPAGPARGRTLGEDQARPSRC